MTPLVLVDTSVWISHFRVRSEQLENILSENKVLIHTFIIGELALGQLKDRKEILSLLKLLPQASNANDHEILSMIEMHKLSGTGIGWVDASLLATAMLEGYPVWTLDKSFDRVLKKLDFSYCLRVATSPDSICIFKKDGAGA
jgi:predicted nucleic acid-binding protein